jgi:hypothetical protein
MGRLLTRTVIAGLALLSLGGAAASRAQDRDEMDSGMSLRRAMRVLREEGYAPSQDRGTDGIPYALFKSGEVNCVLYALDCEGRRCTSLQFRSTFLTKGRRGELFRRVHEWNRTKPFKAYVNDDGSSTYEHDIELVGDGVEEQLKTGLERWKVQVAAFHRFIFE